MPPLVPGVGVGWGGKQQVWLTQGRNVEFTFCHVAFFHP